MQEIPQLNFVTEENNSQYKAALLTWLQSDFEGRGKPKKHFLYNWDTIENAFDRDDAMVVLNKQREIVAYMVWSTYDGGAEIDIAEVRSDYRRQGIFKKMLSDFSDKFPDVYVLSASVLPQSEKIFLALGWQCVPAANRGKKFLKIVKPVLSPSNVLSDGCVIAICAEDVYKVQTNTDQYRHLMQYFQIHLDEDGKLHRPIVSAFHREGYVGIFFNKGLIAEGKAKHLFCRRKEKNGFIVIDRFDPKSPELFQQKHFFDQPELETSHFDETKERPRKRQRIDKPMEKDTTETKVNASPIAYRTRARMKAETPSRVPLTDSLSSSRPEKHETKKVGTSFSNPISKKRKRSPEVAVEEKNSSLSPSSSLFTFGK